MSRYTSLSAWLEETLADTDRVEAASIISIWHRKHEGGTREVKSIALKGKTFESASLAKTIQGTCETFAQEMPGINQFEIHVHYDPKSSPAIHTISIADGEMLQGGRSRNVKEGADAAGLVAQAMRHMEKSQELLVTLVQQGTITSLQREQAAYLAAEKLRNEVNDAYEIVRQVMMERGKEAHDMRMEELKFAKSLDERKRIMELMPALANTVSGREIFPQSVADSKLIEALALKVPPKLLEQLATSGMVDPEVMGPLMARFDEVVRQKKAEEEAIKKLPPTSDEPGMAMTAKNGTKRVDAE